MYKIKLQNTPYLAPYLEYPSVTTVLGIYSESNEGLLNWAVGCAAEYTLQKIVEYGTEKITDIIQKSKTEWKTIRDHTANIGSNLHAVVEKYINIKINRLVLEMF